MKMVDLIGKVQRNCTDHVGQFARCFESIIHRVAFVGSKLISTPAIHPVDIAAPNDGRSLRNLQKEAGWTTLAESMAAFKWHGAKPHPSLTVGDPLWGRWFNREGCFRG